MESVLGIVILLVIGFVCYVIMHSLRNGANALTDKIIEKVAKKRILTDMIKVNRKNWRINLRIQMDSSRYIGIG